MRRLQPFAQRVLRLQMGDWPALLPAPPALTLRITPAGLMEWCGPDDGALEADLQVQVDAANPLLLTARTLAGEPPPVHIEGNAQLAGEVQWLLHNLRWDVAGDMHRLFGPALAEPLQRLGSALARALRASLQGAADLAQRVRPPRP
jgi:ubiquinone biosynthesis protein UbiJ